VREATLAASACVDALPATGALVELAPLPGLVEPFFALTMPRSAPNPVLTMLLQEARQREP